MSSDRTHSLGDADVSGAWEQLLKGRHPLQTQGRKVWARLPSDPRCQMCAAPFEGWGGRIARATGRAPQQANPRYCGVCNRFAQEHPGGALVHASMGFADVRNSTEISVELGPTDFAKRIQRFYAVASELIYRSDAFVDHLVGDAANGFWLPAFAGPQHADRAVHAMATLVSRSGADDKDVPLPVGAGVHTAEIFMGSVGGEGQAPQITGLGEEVNLTARLAGAAGPGELLVSDETLKACDRPPAVAERRRLELKGLSRPVEVNVIRP